MTLTPELILELRQVFADQGWKLSPDDLGIDRYERFVKLLLHLDDEAKRLVLDLTRDFLLHDGINDYRRAVASLADTLPGTGWTQGAPLIALPLIKPADVGELKSGTMSVYLFRSELGRRGWQFHAFDRPEVVNEELPTRTDATVLLVDDFVGTGESALAAAEHFANHLANSSDRVLVVALVAQEAGVAHLTVHGVDVKAAIIRGKGIADSTRLKDAAAAYKTMKAIETLIGVSAKFRFGYGGSEALVSMMSCPNNTFPIYWKAPPDARWASPFERH